MNNKLYGCIALWVILLVVITVFGFITLLLWNNVIVVIFPTVQPITFWLAVGINFVLALIGNFVRSK